MSQDTKIQGTPDDASASPDDRVTDHDGIDVPLADDGSEASGQSAAAVTPAADTSAQAEESEEPQGEEPDAVTDDDAKWFSTPPAPPEPKPVLVPMHPRRPATGRHVLLVGLVMIGMSMLIMAYSVLRVRRENVVVTTVAVWKAQEALKPTPPPPPPPRVVKKIDATKCKRGSGMHMEGRKLVINNDCSTATYTEEPAAQ